MLILIGVGQFIDIARPVDACGINFCPARRWFFFDNHGAANTIQFFNAFACRERVGNFGECTFGVAIEQNIGSGINQYRAAHFIAPVIILGDTTQTGLYAAEHNRHIFVGFFAALAIHSDGAVGAFATHTTGGVGIVRTQA